VIEEAPADSVLVIEARGVTSAGVVGDILAARLKYRGVAALVTDGAVRDGSGVAATGLPVWCAGSAAPASLGEHVGGDLQVAVGCGNVTVIPDDIIVADGDGVVVVPAALAADVAAAAIDQERFEAWVQQQVEAGRKTLGLYPPDAATQAEYDAWRGRPEDGQT
jgi:regulator of RNase E activity RraA